MQQQQMSPMQQNMMARQNLLYTGISMVKRLAPVTASQNTTVKIPLLRMGIMTGVLLQFNVELATAATVGVNTLSQCGPWNLVRRLAYNDFAGVKRCNTSGFQLWAAQSMKMGDALGSIGQQPRVGGALQNSVLDLFDPNNQILNTTGMTNATITESDTVTLQFSLYVPMAYDPTSDLTGAVLTQTNVGEHYIELDLANLFGTDPWANPFTTTSGALALASHAITIQAFQQYIQPQNMGIENLPLIDLSTIYGFEGAYETTANIQAGMSTYINYPNNRSILSCLVNFENNTAFDPQGDDLSGITLMANSNTNFKEMTPRYVKEMMRNLCQFDAPGASYFFPSRRQPILTQLYANVQLKFDVATIGGAGITKFITQYEVQYASGAPLPGLTIAS